MKIHELHGVPNHTTPDRQTCRTCLAIMQAGVHMTIYSIVRFTVRSIATLAKMIEFEKA